MERRNAFDGGNAGRKGSVEFHRRIRRLSAFRDRVASLRQLDQTVFGHIPGRRRQQYRNFARRRGQHPDRGRRSRHRRTRGIYRRMVYSERGQYGYRSDVFVRRSDDGNAQTAYRVYHKRIQRFLPRGFRQQFRDHVSIGIHSRPVRSRFRLHSKGRIQFDAFDDLARFRASRHKFRLRRRTDNPIRRIFVG